MKKILVSGLVNTETTVRVRKFPIDYYPIDYPFFGVHTRVSGVAYNLAKALRTLGDDVRLLTMTGKDFGAQYILHEMASAGIGTQYIRDTLRETPGSVVLYDEEGRRQIYCDLKDVQETDYDFDEASIRQSDVVIACNTNFNRALLHRAKEAGKPIVTDVHVLGDIGDQYNREFMQYADILFLSDENIRTDYRAFLTEIERRYGNAIIVLGMGKKGAMMYVREEDRFVELPAVTVGPVVNTVGAGDALLSAFVHFFAKGNAPVEALKKAELFASYKIGYDGASSGFADEETIEGLNRPEQW